MAEALPPNGNRLPPEDDKLPPDDKNERRRDVILDLDLDYLEKRGDKQVARVLPTLPDLSPDIAGIVKLIFIGDNGVGKTSLAYRFIWSAFLHNHFPTEDKVTYYPSVILHDKLYDIKIIDIPTLPYFPVDPMYDWCTVVKYELHDAEAYILVFDLMRLDTFHYISKMRDQILECRDANKISFIVVGNKQDLVLQWESRVENGTDDSDQAFLKYKLFDLKRKDNMALVKEKWKCGYIECSAEKNVRIFELFRMIVNDACAKRYGVEWIAEEEAAKKRRAKKKRRKESCSLS